MGIDGLEVLSGALGAVAAIGRHIPDIGGFGWLRDNPERNERSGRLFGGVAAFIAAFACFAAALAVATLLAVRWLS
jgi:hypothetical protein